MLRNRDFDHGLDLFNRARYFDAHEALEDVWRPVPEEEPLRLHLQGMVQLAVAFHHQSTGNFVGALSVLERALRNLQGAERSFPSLDFDLLRADLTPWQVFLNDLNLYAEKSQAADTQRPAAPPLPKFMARD